MQGLKIININSLWGALLQSTNLKGFYFNLKKMKKNKLGFTWWAKDWASSEAVFELTLAERGLYRELIDLAMLNDNKVQLKINSFARKFNSNAGDVATIIKVLQNLKLLEIKDNEIFIPSCEPRLNLCRGGAKGGKVTQQSKPTSKPIDKPIDKPIAKPISKPVQPKQPAFKKNLVMESLVPFWNNPQFQEVWIDFEKVRAKKKAATSERAYKKLAKSLIEFCNGSLDDAIKVVSNSADSGWSDLYALKENRATKQTKQSNFNKNIEANKTRSWNQN